MVDLEPNLLCFVSELRLETLAKELGEARTKDNGAALEMFCLHRQNFNVDF